MILEVSCVSVGRCMQGETSTSINQWSEKAHHNNRGNNNNNDKKQECPDTVELTIISCTWAEWSENSLANAATYFVV